MEYKGLPVFSVSIEDDNIFDNISLVDLPAIQTDFIKMAEEVEVKFAVDSEKHIVSGPVIIPEQMIYRNDGHRQFYIKFSKEAIEQMAIRFFRDHRNTEGNVMHQVPVNGVTFYESYLLDRSRAIVPAEFADLPDGTWFVSAKITNEDVWRLVMEGSLRGFSIDAFLTMKPAKDEEIDSISDLVDYLKEHNNK